MEEKELTEHRARHCVTPSQFTKAIHIFTVAYLRWTRSWNPWTECFLFGLPIDLGAAYIWRCPIVLPPYQISLGVQSFMVLIASPLNVDLLPQVPKYVLFTPCTALQRQESYWDPVLSLGLTHSNSRKLSCTSCLEGTLDVKNKQTFPHLLHSAASPLQSSSPYSIMERCTTNMIVVKILCLLFFCTSKT